MIHELKVCTDGFNAVISGRKSYQIWSEGGPYKVGDLLALNEYDGQDYTGNSCLVYVDFLEVMYDYHGEDCVIMSIKPCSVYRHTDPFRPEKLARDYSVPLATNNNE